MSMLTGFPLVNQNTAVTSDGRVSENAQEDCVAASICAACMYLNGIHQLDHDKYNPDKFKDAAYGEALHNSGTAAFKYVPYCASLGVKLYPVEGDYPSLIQQAHTFLAEGKPVIFTQDDWVVDTSLPDYQGWTHVACWYADGPGTLTSMDPWGGFPRMKSDAVWITLLRGKGEIWIAERIEETVRIDITTPGVATYFEELNPHQWRRKDTGKVIQYAILDAYKGYGNSFLCGLSYLGLPLSNEVTIESGIVKQYFERGVLAYDPAHKIDNPPGVGAVYAMHLYSGPGVDPAIASLEAKIAELQHTAQNPLAAQALAAVQQIKPLVQPF